MGGAMDLVSSGAKVIVCMEHTNNKGQPKIIERCNFPLTGKEVVSILITEMVTIMIL
jgi:acyl CoA:acetate/3-ketoacid CoA transferase beta subunit